ncbi:hypothetical protein QHF85_43650 [Polyangium sp. 6x1]|nr:hypothetical protein [Polyangium sp. 6x1]
MLAPRSLLLLTGAAPLVLLTASCGSAPPTPPTVVAPLPKPAKAAEAPAEAPKPEILVAWVETTPPNPVIDGEIDEWGESQGSPSVRLSVTKDGAHLIADLVGDAKNGLWIALSAPAAELRPLGEWGRDGTFYKFDCAEGLEPEAATKCKATLDLHAAFTARHAARFERLFRLDAKGLRWLEAGGLSPVPNAIVASKVKGDRVTTEISLPLSALPRISESPASTFSLAAVTGPADKAPALAPEQRAELSAPESIDFEPHGELRAAARMHALDQAFSYHPAQPNIVELVDFPDRVHGGTSLEPTEQVLWEPVTKLGDLELGYVHVLDTYVGIFKAKKLVDTVLLVGEPKGFVERNKMVHFFGYDEHMIDPIGATSASWSVLAVDATGNTSEPLDSDLLPSGWSSVTAFQDKSFDRFGVRGVPYGGDESEPGGPLEVVWTWNKKKAAYVPSRQVPRGKR